MTGHLGRKNGPDEKKGQKFGVFTIGLAKLGHEKAQTTWQTEIYGEN
jgi:hypothetical protein